MCPRISEVQFFAFNNLSLQEIFLDSDQISTSIRLINSFSLKSNDFDEKYDKNDTNSIKLYDFMLILCQLSFLCQNCHMLVWKLSDLTNILGSSGD